MEEKLVSVVMPIYNAEKYLKDNIPLLLNQTYKNFELILVNDGSKDNSLVICQEFAKKDNRIKVISQENKGVVKTRNVGLKASKGDYIIFVDSDDFPCVNYLSSLMRAIEGADIGLINFKHIKVKNPQKAIKKYCKINQEKVFHDQSYVKNIFNFPIAGGGVLWNKLFKREIIGDLEFDESLEIFEDILFAYEYAIKCKKIGEVKDIVYLYNINNQSVTAHSSFNKKRLDCLKAMEKCAKIAESRNGDEKLYVKAWQFLINIEMLYLLHKVKYKDDVVKEEIRATLKRTYPFFKKNKKNLVSFRKATGFLYRMMQTFKY